MRVQLYNEAGEGLHDTASQDDVYGKGLLHGAVHIWVWRTRAGHVEILVQQRTATMLTFPSKYDASAGGHIDSGEEPLAAAIRETREEIGLEVAPEDLKLIDVIRARLETPEGRIENEFQWVYLLELEEHHQFALQRSEVSSVKWLSLSELQAACKTDEFVPHGFAYFVMLFEALAKEAAYE